PPPPARGCGLAQLVSGDPTAVAVGGVRPPVRAPRANGPLRRRGPLRLRRGRAHTLRGCSAPWNHEAWAGAAAGGVSVRAVCGLVIVAESGHGPACTGSRER